MTTGAGTVITQQHFRFHNFSIYTGCKKKVRFREGVEEYKYGTPVSSDTETDQKGTLYYSDYDLN